MAMRKYDLRAIFKRIGIRKKYGKCNKPLIEAFGLRVINPKLQIAEAGPFERSFCLRNKYTCCNGSSFLKAKKKFLRNLRVIRQSLEPLQELLALFRGPKYLLLINQLQTSRDCHYPIDRNVHPNREDFFKPDNINYYITYVEKQASQFMLYYKSISSFYANLLCGVCNPFEKQYFDLKSDRLKIKVDMNTVGKRIENLEFEINFMYLFEMFISPLAQMVRCHLNLENDFQFYVERTDYLKSQKVSETIQACEDNFRSDNPACVRLLEIKVNRIEFHADLMNPVKQALSVIYHGLTGRKITDYEKEVKGRVNYYFRKPDPFFLDLDVEGVRKINRLSFEVADQGVNIYRDVMSKKFLIDEKAHSWITTTSLIVGFLLAFGFV